MKIYFISNRDIKKSENIGLKINQECYERFQSIFYDKILQSDLLMINFTFHLCLGLTLFQKLNEDFMNFILAFDVAKMFQRRNKHAENIPS